MACRGCGDCCRVLIVPFVDSDLLREFLDARGIDWSEDHGCLEAVVPHVCPHLVGNDCELHGGEQPIACKDFPAEGQRCLHDSDNGA